MSYKSLCFGFAVAAFSCWPADPQALTLVYNYVGAPAEVSNYPEGERPLFNSGRIEIETDAPIRNRTVRFDNAGDPADPALVSVRASFTAIDLLPYPETYAFAGRLTFDRRGGIKDWLIVRTDYANAYGEFGISKEGERFYRRDPNTYSLGMIIANRVLTAKGYVDGTKAYLYHEHGCWAVKPGDDCDDGVWTDLLSTREHGIWIGDDPAALASLLDKRTAQARANPPRSYYDIPPAPIPLPPASLLLLAATAALGCVGMTAATARASESGPGRNGPIAGARFA